MARRPRWAPRPRGSPGSGGARVRPSEQRTLAAVQAELTRAARYDDESIVHDVWARQRYDGGDARRFRAGLPARFAGDQARSEVAAWRHSEAVLLPLRLTIRQVARALLVHPRHLPYPVIAALAGQP